jgi:hypothetical protein
MESQGAGVMKSKLFLPGEHRLEDATSQAIMASLS